MPVPCERGGSASHPPLTQFPSKLAKSRLLAFTANMAVKKFIKSPGTQGVRAVANARPCEPIANASLLQGQGVIAFGSSQGRTTRLYVPLQALCVSMFNSSNDDNNNYDTYSISHTCFPSCALPLVEAPMLNATLWRYKQTGPGGNARCGGFARPCPARIGSLRRPPLSTWWAAAPAPAAPADSAPLPAAVWRPAPASSWRRGCGSGTPLSAAGLWEARRAIGGSEALI